MTSCFQEEKSKGKNVINVIDVSTLSMAYSNVSCCKPNYFLMLLPRKKPIFDTPHLLRKAFTIIYKYKDMCIKISVTQSFKNQHFYHVGDISKLRDFDHVIYWKS